MGLKHASGLTTIIIIYSVKRGSPQEVHELLAEFERHGFNAGNYHDGFKHFGAQSVIAIVEKVMRGYEPREGTEGERAVLKEKAWMLYGEKVAQAVGNAMDGHIAPKELEMLAMMRDKYPNSEVAHTLAIHDMRGYNERGEDANVDDVSSADIAIRSSNWRADAQRETIKGLLRVWADKRRGGAFGANKRKSAVLDYYERRQATGPDSELGEWDPKETASVNRMEANNRDNMDTFPVDVFAVGLAALNPQHGDAARAIKVWANKRNNGEFTTKIDSAENDSHMEYWGRQSGEEASDDDDDSFDSDFDDIPYHHGSNMYSNN
ncbi:hypothetical protein FRB95_014481 [Tulasnella sp. JGI-2019a]|nr:hypothetical protein FRB95_014481 [Tulasnella sp. JGI-2019a]